MVMVMTEALLGIVLYLLYYYIEVFFAIENRVFAIGFACNSYHRRVLYHRDYNYRACNSFASNVKYCNGVFECCRSWWREDCRFLMLSVYSIQTPSLERASISPRKYVLHTYYVA